MKNIVIIAIAAIFCSCGGNAQRKVATSDPEPAPIVTDMHNAENSLDYEGIYKGTLPAADCPGIETILELRGDGTYELIQKYLERDAVYDLKGSYIVEGNTLTLTTDDAPIRYRVEEGRLRMLGADSKPVEGVLVDHYVLNKTE